jgi:hypothetical protein
MQNPMNHILLLYAISAAALLLLLYHFCSLKIELAKAVRRRGDAEALARLDAGLVEVRSALEAHAGDGSAGPSSLGPQGLPMRAAMDVNRRAQALRLYRRGEMAETISAALNLPVAEVKLLLKLQGTPGQK